MILYYREKVFRSRGEGAPSFFPPVFHIILTIYIYWTENSKKKFVQNWVNAIVIFEKFMYLFCLFMLYKRKWIFWGYKSLRRYFYYYIKFWCIRLGQPRENIKIPTIFCWWYLLGKVAFFFDTSAYFYEFFFFYQFYKFFN